MLNSKQKIIRDRAYFVAGRDAWFREENDPLIESAINDAAQYLDNIPASSEQPTISGATTDSLRNILTVHWLVAVGAGTGQASMRTVVISFHGDGLCAVRWSEPSGREHCLQNISVEDVIAMDLPRKVKQLRLANIQRRPSGL